MQKKSAFTLIELLVVLSIVVLLVALLLPSLAQSRFIAMNIRCMSQLKQITVGMVSYVNSYKQAMPLTFLNSGNGNPAQTNFTYIGITNTPALQPSFVGGTVQAQGVGAIYANGDITDGNAFYCPDVEVIPSPSGPTSSWGSRINTIKNFAANMALRNNSSRLQVDYVPSYSTCLWSGSVYQNWRNINGTSTKVDDYVLRYDNFTSDSCFQGKIWLADAIVPKPHLTGNESYIDWHHNHCRLINLAGIDGHVESTGSVRTQLPTTDDWTTASGLACAWNSCPYPGGSGLFGGFWPIYKNGGK